MASFVTKQTEAQRYKFALVRCAKGANVGRLPQILQVLETYKTRRRIEAKHDLAHYRSTKGYRLVKLTNNQQLTRVPVTF